MKLENRTLYFGDNLDILREKIPDESIDLVYLDPPFNSKKCYNVIFKDNESQTHAFDDTWSGFDPIKIKIIKDELILKQENTNISNIVSGFESILGEKSGMFIYLINMTQRLLELYRVLKPTGSIYLHCDPTASHYLKIIMDIIFGNENFRNEIIWHYTGGLNAKNNYPTKHDSIFFYSKGNNFNFNIQREPYAETSAYAKGGIVSAAGKKYMPNSEGKPIDDVWNIPIINPMSKERLGYPTQKPEKLLERIILASSNEGNIVLDPFCGCGTTVSVAEQLNRQWIGIDIATVAIDIMKNRLIGNYPNIKIKIDGLPKDFDGAKKLAESDKYNFQNWIIILLKAKHAPNKTKEKFKGKDYEIDGIITYSEINDKFKTEYKNLIISVKGGGISSKDIRDLNGVIGREKASGGIFVTLHEPTKDMLKEAAQSGTYNYQNKDYPKLQICLVEDLLNGNMPKVPDSKEEPENYKKAERKEVEKQRQRSLFE